MKKIKTRFYFLFLINLSLISFIKNADNSLCDNSRCVKDGYQCKGKVEGSCSSYCKPNLFSSMCYYCSGLTTTNNYYLLNEVSKSCTAESISGCTKIIADSNQCVASCGNYYELGDYCYSSCAGNMEIEDGSERKCKCIALYYKTTTGKVLYTCLGVNVECKEEHKSYDVETKECSTNSCINGQKKKTKKRAGMNDIIRCSYTCEKDEFLYNEYCRDNCPNDKQFYYIDDNRQKVCTSNCKDHELYYIQGEKKCVSIDECDYVNDKICLQGKDCLHNFGSKVCVSSCGVEDEYKYKDEDNNICYKNCPTKYVRESDNNKCENNDVDNCLFIEAEEHLMNRKCYRACPSTYPYRIFKTQKCSSTPCHQQSVYKYSFFKDEKICYSSCASIPFIGKKYYEDDNYKCICYLYGKKDEKYKCYNDEASCKSDGFSYKQGNECLINCGAYVYDVKDNTKLDECYADEYKCLEKEYPYYNKDDKKCYTTLPADRYPNEIDPSTNLPKRDSNGNTYQAHCNSNLKFLSRSGVCKDKCDEHEYYISNAHGGYDCKVDCNDNGKTFISESGECIAVCPFKYIEEFGKKKCVPNCKSKGKFYKNNEDKKCYDSCKDINLYYYNPGDNHCLTNCKTNGDNKYAYPVTNNIPEKCISKPEGKCYNEDFIIVGDSCKIYSSSDPQLCITSCNSKVSNLACMENCPDLEGPYISTAIEGINVNKCDIECLSGQTIEAFTNHCLSACNDALHALYNGRCYPICSNANEKYNPASFHCENCEIYEKINVGGKVIKICKIKCEGEKLYMKNSNDKECVKVCESTKNIIGLDHICTDSCNTGEFKMESLIQPSGISYKIYECVKRCPTESNYFYNGNECVTIFPGSPHFIIENQFESIPQCTVDYPYYYKDEKNTNYNYYTCTKRFKCGTNGYNPYYCDGECKTGNDLKNNYVIINNVCKSSCTNPFLKKQRENYNDNDIIICKEECASNEYTYGDKCLKECPKGTYIDLYNNCQSGCGSTVGGAIYYYPVVGNDDTTEANCIFKCAYKCPEEFPYYSNSRRCYKNCPIAKYTSIQDNYCYDSNCNGSPTNKLALEAKNSGGSVIARRCLSKCNDPEYYEYKYKNGNKCEKNCNGNYAIEITNECTTSCGTGYYKFVNSSITGGAQNKFCVKRCPLPTFRDGDECIYNCKSNTAKKFYIKEFKHGEDPIEKICRSECPDYYPFYNEVGSLNECVEKCEDGYYYTKTIKATIKIDNKCLPQCIKTNSVYKYKIESETSKICYDECPEDSPFYKLNDDDNNCYKECPPDAPYHENDASNQYFHVCKTLEYCNNSYVDFDDNLCLGDSERCGSKKTTKYEYKTGYYKYICSNECIPTYGKYLTDNNTCVNECDYNNLHLIKDPRNPRCICENLFYIKDDGTKICYGSSENKECRDMTNYNEYKDYKFNLYRTKECVKDCSNGILSPDEDICHPDREYNCLDYVNTHKVNQKCECIDRNYIDPNTDKTICLKEGDVCPKGYENKYAPEEHFKRCIKEGDNCPSPYNKLLFADKYCLSKCPTGSTGDPCTCTSFWEMNNQGNVNCLSSCSTVSIPSENKKCVNRCEGQYSYYYDDECYTSCNSSLVSEIRIKNAIEVFYDNFDKSEYKCECKKEDFWYIENGIKYCVPDCFSVPNHQFKFVVKETSQCVYVCPSDSNKFFFNKECFYNCETEARSKYHLTLKTDTKDLSNYECQCDYLWHYDSGNQMKECINENLCILSNTTKKFLSDSKNECVEKCSVIGKKGFNYLCYGSYPENTTENEYDDKIFDCFCDLKLGYWFEYEQYNNTYYTCALDECPLFHNDTDNKTYVRMNLIESEKKCVKSCKDGRPSNKNVFALRAICIESCPDLTYTNDDNDVCLFFDLNDTRIDSLDKFKRAANVQAKELYEKSQNLGGFLYNIFNTSLEIYAVDLKNTLKDISFKSNLTYIDFDTCIKKIFEHNKDYLNESLTILVAKYDLLPDANINIEKEGSDNDKYFINPVEYELFSSNKNEKLDTSVCSPYELIISYPLLLNKFDKYEGDINKNELRRKFEMGKELYHMDNGIDTFNYNDSIYKTFCRGIEINGKDLLYEDRYKYLYPNGKIICESNCTLNNTDFELERINCLCSYKNEFDFNRVEKGENDIFNNPNFNIPTQSPYNVEVVKCIFNFTLKQITLYNGAFYYSAVSLLVQISMVILSATYGIKSAIANARHLLNRVNFNDNKIGRRIQFKENNFKNDRIMTTNMPLNHPPKKKDVKEKYNEDIDLDSNIENDEINNTILENENELDSNNNEGGNYEINLKIGNKANNKNPLLESKDSINSMNAEFIPPDYNFKFFKPNDRGVIKKIDRCRIPFEINPDTKYLLERKKGIEYPENYLNGPYFQEQNIVIITDEKNNDVNKVLNYIKNEKLKNNQKPNNNKNDENKINKEGIKADYNIKKRNNLIGDNNILNEKGEKNLIGIKKLNQKGNEDTEKSLLKEFDEKEDLRLKVAELGLLSAIKREQAFLRINYENYLRKEHSDIFCVYLAEILDKIYFAKICLFLKEIDIFPIHLSLYMFCHLLLLSLITGLFTIKLIKKIWDEENFPDFNFYILYGLIINIIIWIIYQIFLCLLDNRDKLKALIISKNELIKAEKNGRENMNEINYNIFRNKYNSYKFLMKCKIIVFYIIVFLFTLPLAIYLISFFALYTGTKRRVLKAYYISIVEILLIKFIYGFILCSLRLASKVSKIRCLYNIIYFLSKYVS